NHLSVKVPIDDTHTRNFRVFVDVVGEHHPPEPVQYYVESTADAKTPAEASYPFARYSMEQLRHQDFMVLETQGPIAPRETERLATSDRGIVLMRTILMREIERLRDGVDPMGVIRDPERAVIDTHT